MKIKPQTIGAIFFAISALPFLAFILWSGFAYVWLGQTAQEWRVIVAFVVLVALIGAFVTLITLPDD